LDVSIRKWNEIAIEDIAEVTCAAKPTEMKSRAATVKRLLNWLQEVEDSSVVVLAHSGAALVGWLMLHKTSQTTLEMNPGALGGHPLVSPENDSREIGIQLIKEALSWAQKETFEIIEIWLQRTPEESDQQYKEYETWYGSLGFVIQGTSVDMVCNLATQDPTEIVLPADFELHKIKGAAEDALYQCYYAAFSAGEAQFFLDQSDNERREYFNTLGIRGALNEDASLVLMKAHHIIGFTVALPYGTRNLHLSCICIHPDFGQRGLGKLLLLMTMKKAAQQGIKTMTLFTDTNMRGFQLYKRSGWKETKRYIKYRWKANNA
jgi:ribosomal protein S18 acetylase RimI-like enzyme